MGTWLPETCRATCKGEIKDNTKVTSSWFLIHTELRYTVNHTSDLPRNEFLTDEIHGDCESRRSKTEWLSAVTDFLHNTLVLQMLLVRQLYFVVVRYERRASYSTETISLLAPDLFFFKF